MSNKKVQKIDCLIMVAAMLAFEYHVWPQHTFHVK